MFAAARVRKVGTMAAPSISGSRSSTWWPSSVQSFTVSASRRRHSGSTLAPFGALAVQAIFSLPGFVPASSRYGRAGKGATYGSPGPAPRVASRSAAVSRTVRVTACSVDTEPSPSPEKGAKVLRLRVGLRPTSPQQAAGARMDPKPSEAWAIGSMRAPTAAAAPPLEPPEMCAVFQGLRVGPCSCGSQVNDKPSSQVLVRPKMTSPAFFRRFTCSLSVGEGGVSAKNFDPRVMRTPATGDVRSFIRKGTPRNGPSGRPSAIALRP